MRKIVINTIPHNKHRYPTCGDYWTDKDGIEQIRVSYMKDWRYGFLVYLHELIELGLTRNSEIKEEDIAAFDVQFDKEGKDGEPGDDLAAPYRKEHFFATTIESLVAEEIGVDWKEYGEAIDKLLE